MITHASEVAQIRQRITDESLAATLGLCGLASGTTRHDFINARTEHLGKDLDELTQALGSRDEALSIVIEAMSSAEHPTRHDIRSSLLRELPKTEENAQLRERLEDAWELYDTLTERFGTHVAHTIIDASTGISEELPS